MKKTILIILGIMLCVAIAIPTIFVVGLIISEVETNNERDRLHQQAIVNVEAYIQEKYPEKNLQIEEVEVDEIYNGFVQSGWSNIVEVKLQDSNGNEYVCITDATKTKNEGIKFCRDNVQKQEIEDAIELKVKTSTNMTMTDVMMTNDFDISVTSNVVIEFDSMYYGDYFNEKYTGDIIQFLKNHKNMDSNPVEVGVWVAYKNQDAYLTNIKNTDIFDALNFTAFIEFNDIIPSNENWYSKTDAEWIHNTLKTFNIEYESIYTYNKASKEFREFVKTQEIMV